MPYILILTLLQYLIYQLQYILFNQFIMSVHILTHICYTCDTQ